MYKVLLVDDEPTVREGLRKIIAWTSYGFEIAGVAKDGQSALQLCQEVSFDLIISDIRMAGMDGLQFLKKVREFDTRVQCIVLSGYADFEYAKQAIKCNVAGYLLKPIDEDELILHVTNVKKELDMQLTETEGTMGAIERKIEQLILSLIEEKFEEKQSKLLPELAKQYELDWEKYELLLMEIKGVKHETLLEIKQEVESVLPHRENRFLFLRENQVGILWDGAIFTRRAITNYGKQLQKIGEQFNLQCTLAIGTRVKNLQHLSQSYQTALALLEHQFFYPKNTVLMEGKEVIQGCGNLEVPIDEAIETVYLALEIGQFDCVKTIIQQLASLHFSEQRLKKNIVCVLLAVLHKLIRTKPEKHSYLTKMSERLLEIYEVDTYFDLLYFVEAFLTEIHEQLKYEVESKDQLKKLLVLIDTKYNENLKLERLAEVFNYNSAYLGKLFKSYTGEYFNTYLDKVRIENAKKLLLQNYKVYKVAEIVGYSNVDYFHSKFKKYVGISPSAYRRKEKV
ncbi:response regulator [Alkalihalobacterium bogoriense]|uniref:response regulator n=1 Tax=Alkalihalobacterium bogoriense TaxID=246272 RepID=UPI00047AA88A|nr:response regulator [Alkalihalobacterium bogoriense]